LRIATQSGAGQRMLLPHRVVWRAQVASDRRKIPPAGVGIANGRFRIKPWGLIEEPRIAAIGAMETKGCPQIIRAQKPL